MNEGAAPEQGFGQPHSWVRIWFSSVFLFSGNQVIVPANWVAPHPLNLASTQGNGSN